jgi:hypothetical protein
MTPSRAYWLGISTGLLIGVFLAISKPHWISMPLWIIFVASFIIINFLYDYYAFRGFNAICFLFGHKLSRYSSAPNGLGQGFDQCERCPYVSEMTIRRKGEVINEQ